MYWTANRFLDFLQISFCEARKFELVPWGVDYTDNSWLSQSRHCWEELQQTSQRILHDWHIQYTSVYSILRLPDKSGRQWDPVSSAYGVYEIQPWHFRLVKFLTCWLDGETARLFLTHSARCCTSAGGSSCLHSNEVLQFHNCDNAEEAPRGPKPWGLTTK